jgi:hypothetical protein
MDQLQRNTDVNKRLPEQSYSANSSSEIAVEVSCDDCTAHMFLEGHETISQVRDRALQEMQMIAPDSRRYIVIDSNRQPVNDRLTIDELISQGLVMHFRLVPQVAFGLRRCCIGEHNA